MFRLWKQPVWLFQTEELFFLLWLYQFKVFCLPSEVSVSPQFGDMFRMATFINDCHRDRLHDIGDFLGTGCCLSLSEEETWKVELRSDGNDIYHRSSFGSSSSASASASSKSSESSGLSDNGFSSADRLSRWLFRCLQLLS